MARRRVFLAQTIEKFQRYFGFSLLEHEKAHLAALLKVERPAIKKRRNENRVQPAVQDNAILTQTKNARSEEEIVEGESDEGEEEAIEQEWEWLNAEGRSMVKVLRENEPNSIWSDDY